MEIENTKSVSAQSSDVYGDYASVSVPLDMRRSFFSSFLVFSGVVICAAALWLGNSLSQGLNLIDSLIACFIGFGITGIIGGFLSYIGAEHGVSSVMLGRHVFGRYGTTIVGLIFAITNWGWYAFQAGFFGLVLNTMFPNHFFTQTNIAALWGGLLMMTSAIIGYKGLAFLSFLSIPLMIIVIAAGDAAVLAQTGLVRLLAASPAKSITLAQGITIAAGGMAAGAVIAPDVSRYSKSGIHGFWAFFLALTIVNNFVVLSGSALTLATGEPNLPKAMVTAGLGAASLLMLILAQWTTNDNNLYSTSLALLNLVRIKKSCLTLILGVSASIVAYLGVVDYLIPYLTFLGTYIPPIGGIILADYFLVKPILLKVKTKQRYEFGPGTVYDNFDILAIALMVVSGYMGSKIPGIAAINAVIVGFVGYFVLVVIFRSLGIPYRFGRRIEDETGF